MLIRDFNRQIHQIWFQKNDDSPGTITNEDYNRCRELYINFAKQYDWGYKLWDEISVNQLIKEFFPSYLEEFNSLDSIIKKVDCARYMILYVYGGVYVDVDSYPKRSLEEFINLSNIERDKYAYTAWHISPNYKITHEYELVVGQEKTVYELHYSKFGIKVPKLNNAVIFASPKSDILLKLIDIGFKRAQNSILNSFGAHTFSLYIYEVMNSFVNKMLQDNDYSYQSPILSLPPVYFYEPDVERDDYLHWGGTPEHKNSPLQFIVHKFAGDWDNNSYGEFLTQELVGEELDGTNKKN